MWTNPLTLPPGSPPYYTARQAAAYLGLAYCTFRKRATRITFQAQTGRYHRDDLNAYARSLKPRKKW